MVNGDPRISIVGLGKLGASMAAATASRGLEVVGVDVNPRAVDLVNSARAPVDETGLADLVAENAARLRATTDMTDAVAATDVTFVIVPTPSDENGGFSLVHASRAFAEIGRALRRKSGYHLVILTSTVLPGATRQTLVPILERESGKAAGRDVGVCYSPEFVALGSVIRDFLNPDLTLVGEIDERSGGTLERVYARVLAKPAACHRMSLENAELTKIALNTFVTTKIAFANMLADLCERLPGGDVDVVTSALGADRRIGRAYLTGGVAYGGPCFPRDNAALAHLARVLGTRATLAETTDAANRAASARLLARCLELVPAGASVAVLGLGYKPDTPVVEESAGLYLAQGLAAAGRHVVAYDPLVSRAAAGALEPGIDVADSLAACLAGASAVVITTRDRAFNADTLGRLIAAGPATTVVDCWRVFERGIDAGRPILHVAVGRGAGAGGHPSATKAPAETPEPARSA
jgi:UDPglucose 6-dehydrogenase